VACTVVGAAVVAAQSRVQITGVYSDLRYNAQGGDLLGMEVFIVVGPGGYFATVQCAGGEPAKPELVPVSYSNGHVDFTLAAAQPECRSHFRGTITRRGLRGRFDGETTDRQLPRRKSYWQ
jgi:hypothetical protein